MPHVLISLTNIYGIYMLSTLIKGIHQKHWLHARIYDYFFKLCNKLF